VLEHINPCRVDRITIDVSPASASWRVFGLPPSDQTDPGSAHLPTVCTAHSFHGLGREWLQETPGSLIPRRHLREGIGVPLQGRLDETPSPGRTLSNTTSCSQSSPKSY
jgi:hypothetical protein